MVEGAAQGPVGLVGHTVDLAAHRLAFGADGRFAWKHERSHPSGRGWSASLPDRDEPRGHEELARRSPGQSATEVAPGPRRRGRLRRALNPGSARTLPTGTGSTAGGELSGSGNSGRTRTGGGRDLHEDDARQHHPATGSRRQGRRGGSRSAAAPRRGGAREPVPDQACVEESGSCAGQQRMPGEGHGHARGRRHQVAHGLSA